MNSRQNEAIATIAPSPARRAITTLLLLVLGGLLIDSSFANRSAVVFGSITMAIGVASIALAYVIYRTTRHSIELRGSAVVSTDGTLLAELDNISKIEIGLLDFKPASGFTIRLHEPMPAAWKVGLWWRIGRSVGIGGCTPKSDAKQFATILQARLQGIKPMSESQRSVK
ncbi:MAG: hypothetical protein OXB95_08795 [Rhodobacteraceae bacterium]|nr:hypothetical protein [Paracoccaceae bacterium]